MGKLLKPMSGGQVQVVELLRSHGNMWSEDSDWCWVTRNSTKMMLDRMQVRGIVDKFEGRYTLCTKYRKGEL